MAHAFTRGRRGVRVRLDDDEREVLRRMFRDTAELLSAGAVQPGEDEDPLAAAMGLSEGAETPVDPALARLLPDAHRDDHAAATEFRRYTERGLRDDKRAQLQLAVLTLDRPDPLTLSDDEALAWARAMNDVRLVIAERLEVRDDDDLERLRDSLSSSEDDQSGDVEWQQLQATVAVYEFLTWLQETLAGVLLDGLGRERP